MYSLCVYVHNKYKLSEKFWALSWRWHYSNFGTTIVYFWKMTLKDICEHCSHFGCSIVVWQSFVPVDVNGFVKMRKNEYWRSPWQFTNGVRIDWPPYLSDLTPNDFFLFSRLKIRLERHRFSSNKNTDIDWHKWLSNNWAFKMAAIFTGIF